MIEPEITTRSATVDDIDALLANLRAGFETYVEFAPADRCPPEPDRERTLAQLGDPNTWALLGITGGRAIGHVAFTPSRGNRSRTRTGGERRRQTPARPTFGSCSFYPSIGAQASPGCSTTRRSRR